MKNLIIILFLSPMLNGCSSTAKLSTSAGITQSEAAEGIRQALSQGLAKAVLQLNKEDGFFNDVLYKIPLPPDATKIQSTLQDLGLGKMVDKAILQINRGAEDAAGYAKPIFIDAIIGLTLSNAAGLVRHGDTSATHYFRVKTTDKLIAAFLPVVIKSLNKVEATKYYGDMVDRYNSIPATFKKLNPDLPGYVTRKTVDALFDLVGKEEVNIRNNPAARTTDILKKVFGEATK